MVPPFGIEPKLRVPQTPELTIIRRRRHASHYIYTYIALSKTMYLIVYFYIILSEFKIILYRTAASSRGTDNYSYLIL